MKRVLLSVLVVGLLAGQAFGGLYVLDKPTALTFTKISATDDPLVAPFPPYPARGSLDLGPVANPNAAYGPMLLQVGFAGDLGDGPDAGNTASIRIGKTYAAGGGLSGYDGWTTKLANDDDDPWSVRLFAVDGTPGTKTSGFFALAPGATTWLSVLTSGSITQFGIDIEGTFIGGLSPSNPDVYHISAVPIPGAVLLGFLGLSAAGLGLRKLA